MSLSNLFKKATSLLGLSSPENQKPPPMDGEIIFCKNNVCVHPPAILNHESQHHPGYLNVRSQDDEVLGSTLILTWIPNSTLKNNPRSIESSPSHPHVPSRRSPRQEYAHSDQSPSTSPRESTVSTTSEADCDCSAPKTCLEDGKEDNSQNSKDSSINNPQDTASDPALKEESITNTTQQTADSSSRSSSVSSDNKQQGATVQNRQKEGLRRKERTDSGRSVTSIEMEGENLVVVTEEMDDSTFLDNNDSKASTDGSSVNCEVKTNKDQLSESPDSMSVSSDSTYPSPTGEHYYKMLRELQGEQAESETKLSAEDITKLKDSLDLKLNVHSTDPGQKLSVQSTDPSQRVTTPDIEISGPCDSMSSSSSSTPTSGPDSNPPSPFTPPLFSPESSSCYQSMTSENGDCLSPEVSHHMSFPHNAVIYSSSGTQPDGALTPRSAKEQLCGVFSVDLGQMRSLRIFYSNDACTSGQLVIASRESQYKVLHFHHGGLDRLADVFSDWSFLAQPKDKMTIVEAMMDSVFEIYEKPKELDAQCKHFSVIRPHLPNTDCHPEEGVYDKVTEVTWKQHMNGKGQIEDDFHLRKAIFFSGLEPSVRHEMWPFLLHYYPYNSTFEDREQIRNDKYIEYQNIRKKRDSMTEFEKEQFWRNIQCTVEKDVVRTDRSHPYFKGEDNPNIEILKNILLNYAVAHPHYGYTQGMSDLLAPVLVEVQNEVDTYWCFVGLMQKTIFVSSPKDIDMDKQLNYLRELLRLMCQDFYERLRQVEDGLELLFCHRWILLCFKREFPEPDALRMWEACWAHFQTDYFHLFLCVAIIIVYGEDVVQQNLPADEMLLHFGSLSMHMNANVVLKKARGLLHRFRTRRKIPCTLFGLCSLCGPGMWDSGHVPTVRCMGNHQDGQCPYTGNREPPN